MEPLRIIRKGLFDTLKMQYIRSCSIDGVPVKATVLVFLGESFDQIDPILAILWISRCNCSSISSCLAGCSLTPNQRLIGGQECSDMAERKGDSLARGSPGYFFVCLQRLQPFVAIYTVQPLAISVKAEDKLRVYRCL